MEGMNYGRRVPQEAKAPEVLFVPNEKKPFFSFLKKKQKNVSIESDTFFVENNLFIPEVITIVIAIMASVFIVFVSRLMILGQFEAQEALMEEGAYGAIASAINTANSLTILAVAIPCLVLAMFFVYKFFVFRPRKNKVPVLRVWKSGLMRFSVEKVQPEMMFDKTPTSDEVHITQPRKHFDNNTGRPVLVLREGEAENASILPNSQVSQKAQDESNARASTWGTACRFTEYNIKKEASLLKNPLFILLIFVCIGLAVLGWIIIRQPEQLKAMLGQSAPVIMTHLGVGF